MKVASEENGTQGRDIIVRKVGRCGRARDAMLLEDLKLDGS